MRWTTALLVIFLSCTTTPALDKLEVDGPMLVPTDLYLQETWLGRAMTARDIMMGPSAVQLGAAHHDQARAALADPRPTWRRTRYQGVVLARMCASEDTRALRPTSDGGSGGALTGDHWRILHTVLNNAGSRSFSNWTEVMQFLSPHVAGAVEANMPRQQWTSTLPAEGKDAPSGWVTERDGPWLAYADNWERFRDSIVRAWLSLRIEPITGAPIAWGNAADVERGIRVRGLTPIPCADCVNGFLERRAPVVVSAAEVARAWR